VLANDHVERHGSEVPVVLVHAGVADRRMWTPQWGPLTEHLDAVRVDLRGFGESDAAPTEPFSHPGDLWDTLDELGPSRCHLVGASLGAGVALEAALARPDAVDSLCLVPPGGSLLATRTEDLAEFAAAEDAALLAGDLDAAVQANLEAWVAGRGRPLEQVDPEVVAAVARMQRRAFEIQLGWGREAEELEVEPARDPMHRLAEVTAPVLLVVGGHDLDTVLDSADRLEHALDDLTRVEWPDVAHLPSLEQPERFSALLLEWLIP
jgi:pimeloyl-ACP methyl ester carboxylesterase